MDNALILAELEAQARTMPVFMTTAQFVSGVGLTPADYEWLGRTISLLTLWNSRYVIPVRIAAQNLHGPLFQQNVATIHMTLHEAISFLRLVVREQPAGAVFAPNTPLDFFQAFKDVIGQATADLFVIDAYLDEDVFPYLTATPATMIRLLMKHKPHVPLVRAAQQAFRQQYQQQVETRESADIHDRVVFVDGKTCYLLGASIKDAAQRRPTYIVALSAELVPAKLAVYEAIWNAATPI